MRRRGDQELESRLRELRAPDETEAEERSLEVVRAAYADHVPLKPSRSTRRIGVAAVCGAVALAIGLSPAGAKVGDLVSDVFDRSPGEPNAKPELRSLPTAGQLLVQSDAGLWVVQDDGSKRLLGDYDEGSWSPHGIYVVAARDRTLTALTAGGEIHWTFPTPETARDPRWTGSSTDTRIAYRSGHDLRVIAGDGNPATDHLLARDIAGIAPAWRPHGFVVAYRRERGGVRAVNADTGAQVPVTVDDLRRLSSSPTNPRVGRALAPDGLRVANLEHVGATDSLLSDAPGQRARLLFSAHGRLTGPTWSPDSRWILIGWPAADQWLFVNPQDPKDVRSFERISAQFDSKHFPRVSGWMAAPD